MVQISSGCIHLQHVLVSAVVQKDHSDCGDVSCAEN